MSDDEMERDEDWDFIVNVNVAERVLGQVTAAAAKAVSSLHRPMPTTLGDDVFACEHCTTLRKVHIIRWPCPTWVHARKTGIEAAGADNNNKGETT